MRDTRWLEKRGKTYYAVRDVPRPLRRALGKKRFLKSLQTHDYHVAISLRHAALAEFERQIAAARSDTAQDARTMAALHWRSTFQAIKRGDAEVIARYEPSAEPLRDLGPYDEDPRTPQQAAYEAADMLLDDALDRVREEDGLEAAQTFAAMAYGHATPLLHYVEAWLTEGGHKGPLSEKTKAQYRSDMVKLEAWTREAGIASTIEAFTRRVVGRYINETIIATGMDRATANRKLSASGSYWRWLIKRGVVEVSPWAGQSMSKAKSSSAADDGRDKRPFTDAELATLLAGGAEQVLADAMRIAALSGMRIEEIHRLTVADCGDGWFRLRRSKTRAGLRRIPIHSDLADIVRRRVEGKAPGDFLMHEAGPEQPKRERSALLSKRFGRYRKALGVDDRAEGKRQSRIDFHSFRRWFITKARNAGFDSGFVAVLAGHETGHITDDLYSGGPDDGRKRECVEAIRLPPQTCS